MILLITRNIREHAIYGTNTAEKDANNQKYDRYLDTPYLPLEIQPLR